MAEAGQCRCPNTSVGYSTEEKSLAECLIDPNFEYSEARCTNSRAFKNHKKFGSQLPMRYQGTLDPYIHLFCVKRFE